MAKSIFVSAVTISVCAFLAQSCSATVPNSDRAPQDGDDLEMPVSVNYTARLVEKPGAVHGSSDNILPTLPLSDVGDGAALRGHLVIDGECAYVKSVGERTLIASTMLDAIRRPGEDFISVGAQRFNVGDQVMLGGSFASPSVLQGAWIVAPSKICDTRKIWVTVMISKL